MHAHLCANVRVSASSCVPGCRYPYTTWNMLGRKLLYCTNTVAAKFTADTDTGIGIGASLNDTAQVLP